MVFINPGEKPVLRMHFYRRRAYSVYLWPCPISRGTTHCLSPSDKTQGPEMAITREQTQMPKSLIALGDDPLRAALSFLSVSECRRSVGATAKHFRALAASTALARTRFSDRYVSSRPFPPPAFAFGLSNLQMLI